MTVAGHPRELRADSHRLPRGDQDGGWCLLVEDLRSFFREVRA